MPTPVTRLSNTGNFYTTGVLDEVSFNPTVPYSKNLFAYSTQLNNSYWANYNDVNYTTATSAPDGSNTAFLMISTGSYPNNRPSNNLTVIPNTYYTLSAYVKYGNTQYCTMANETGVNAVATFDLINGTINNLAYNASNPIITSVGNGWWRISMVILNGNFNYMDPEPFRIGVFNSQPPGETMYCWGPQLELGIVATDYEPTGAGGFALSNPGFTMRTDRGGVYTVGSFDEVSINPTSGTNTNLIAASTTWTFGNWTGGPSNITVMYPTAATLAPDGTQTAYKQVYPPNGTQYYDVATGQGHWLFANAPLNIGTTYTFSVYAKAAEWTWLGIQFYDYVYHSTGAEFNITTGVINSVQSGITPAITQLPNGWWRCSITITVTQTQATGGGVNAIYVYGNNIDGGLIPADGQSGIYLWGPQLEVGAVPTDYIPTNITGPAVPFVERKASTGLHRIAGNYDEVGPMIVTKGLTYYMDPGSLASYPGTGNQVFNLATNSVAGVLGGIASQPAFATNNGGVFNFTSASKQYIDTNFLFGKAITGSNGTICVWAYLTGAAPVGGNSYGGQCIVGDDTTLTARDNTTTTPAEDYIWVNRVNFGGKDAIWFGGWNNGEQSFPVAYQTNTWIHLTWQINAGTITAYYNGINVGQSVAINNGAVAGAGGELLYFGYTPGYGPGFSGSMGPIACYNRALSAAEVYENFSSQRSRFGV